MFKLWKKSKNFSTKKYSPKLSADELAIAMLVFCCTADKRLPNGIADILDSIDPEPLKEPYKSLLLLWKDRSPDYVLDEMGILFSILLEQSIKDSRQKNKDYVKPETSATPVVLGGEKDWYDEIDWGQ
jgi:hypothetical protein